MKKFKGIVNGVSYDSEKDYKEAVDKAIKAGNINASSQYIEVNEPEPKTESYKLTKEDIDEIKLFNKNFKSLRSLLDDVMSELDSNRRDALLNSIEGIQTIITCTGYDDFIRKRINIDMIYKVTNGKVEKMIC